MTSSSHWAKQKEAFRKRTGVYPNRVCELCQNLYYSSSLITRADMIDMTINFLCPNCREHEKPATSTKGNNKTRTTQK